MFKLVLAVCLLYLASPSFGSKVHNHQPLSDELINFVNNEAKTTWKAGKTDRFKSVGDIKMVLGVLPDAKLHQLPIKHIQPLHPSAIPDTFDARTQWASCPSIKEIRDQSACGSCWALGAVEAMTDRICIASQGKVSAHISAGDLMSCCDSCGAGCDGGYPASAWQYWVTNGIVTGGQYGTKEGCKPYPFPQCEHHVNGTHYPPCPSAEYPTPRCVRMCQTGYTPTYQQDKKYGTTAYGISSDISAIQTEIMTNGPVEVDFTVYADFPSYKSGVYKHTTGAELGGHAVKMMGWGTEAGTPYWLIANSWNGDWGDMGTFKILRGADECGIESDVQAGEPKFT